MLYQCLTPVIGNSSTTGGGLVKRYWAEAPASQKDDDTASEASWSADAFGKSKTPGWYHTSRKQLYQHRSKLASTAPKGVYTSHTKYADEAVRIKNTGRLAF